MTAIVINFDTPWIAAASPIVLSFTDDPTPEVPEVPISAGTIGIMCGIGIAIGQSVAQQLTIASATESHGIRLVPQWQVDYVKQQLTAKWQAKALLGVIVSIGWRWNNLVLCKADLLWLVPDSHSVQAASLWLSPEAAQTMVEMPWRQPKATTQFIALGDMQAGLAATEIRLHHSDIRASGDMRGIAWGPHAARWVCSSKYNPPKGKITFNFSEPWVNASSPIVLNFTPSPNVCYWDDGGGLIGTNPSLPNIDFKIPIEPQIRRYYLMQPTLTCVRVSDNLPIVVSNVSISQSRGQWARAVSLEFSSRIDAERAHNELLLITINGYEFYAIAEQPSANKVFGTATYNSTGRSRVAELAAPYKLPLSHTNATARSFAGLLGDLLQNTGWTIELNGIPDFTIPAGAFSVGNKSPIEAVAEAVGQLGCMILTDDATNKLTIVPRWPTAPWAMAAAVPDLALHDAVITSYSDSVSRNPLCNVVWLRGEQQGIDAKVKRAGSAGNIPTADIIAQLIVDNQAARVAGTNALAETGDKLSVNLSMPVMADLPPATPGMLLGVTINGEVFKGVCDSWSIRATVSERGDIDIEQSVTLVCPLE
ncbi:hypothetical protein [Shewanella mangrovisoli]|uniref:hypothetical protein n=1 Tax=Shewanella mangrovisoli TaxID=2864211 RepID=UPI001C659EAC|nr:hypothetical protein [Shewanella mangrovisoli]QYK07562.1 hypothetical protein K0H60_11990 [Shewanella mangrovisoli]